jgi:hypothetical protein
VIDQAMGKTTTKPPRPSLHRLCWLQVLAWVSVGITMMAMTALSFAPTATVKGSCVERGHKPIDHQPRSKQCRDITMERKDTNDEVHPVAGIAVDPRELDKQFASMTRARRNIYGMDYSPGMVD